MTDETVTKEDTELEDTEVVELWMSGTEEPGRSWGIEPTDEGAQEKRGRENDAAAHHGAPPCVVSSIFLINS